MPALLEQLSAQIRAIELGGRRQGELPNAISSGCQELDRLLPEGGYAPGTIIEWIEPTLGCGGVYLAIAAARHAMADGKYLLVVDPQQRFYPPAAQAMGIPLERLIVLRPGNESDLMWSIDQALRCSAVGAVIAHLDRVSELQARRLQLAAEQGQTLGCWLRPWKIQRAPSWAEIQWLVRPITSHPPGVGNTTPNIRRIGLEALRMRSGAIGRRWTLAIDTQSGQITMEKPHAITGSLCLAAQLAMPKSECDARRRTEATTVRTASA